MQRTNQRPSHKLERYSEIYARTVLRRQRAYKRNGLESKLLRLPVELILKIVMHYRDAQTYDGLPYEWLRITHVCSRLREITLGSPTLWTTIDALRWDCVREMLRRAQDQDVAVYASVARTQSARLRDLSLLLRDLSQVSLLCLALDGRSASVLKSLSLRSDTSRLTIVDVEIAPHSGPVPRLSALLKSEFLTLETLYYSADTPLNLSDLAQSSQLKVLSLINSGDFTSKLKTTTDGLVKFLAALPALETLILNEQLPLTKDDTRDLERTLPMTLPSLHTLKIRYESAEVVANFLSRLSMPSLQTCLLRIEGLNGLLHLASVFSKKATQMQTSVDNGGPPNALSLVQDMEESRGIFIRCGYDGQALETNYVWGINVDLTTLNLGADGQVVPTGKDTVELLAEFIRGLPVQNISTADFASFGETPFLPFTTPRSTSLLYAALPRTEILYMRHPSKAMCMLNLKGSHLLPDEYCTDDTLDSKQKGTDTVDATDIAPRMVQLQWGMTESDDSTDCYACNTVPVRGQSLPRLRYIMVKHDMNALPSNGET